MEKIYRKKKNGRYEAVGYNTPDISDGIWLVQSEPGVKHVSNLVYKIGDIKEPVDVIKEATIHSMGDMLTNYIMKLRDEDSEEYKEAKELLGGFLRGAPTFSNISAYDFTTLVLRKISQQIK